MPCLADVRAANAAILGALKTVPVAVFVGGTSGIGQATAEAFARHTKGNAHIIICGRNRQAAEKIFECIPSPTSPEAKREFVECDVTLMKNVHSVSQDLVSRLPKLNYLVLTTGILTMKARDETSEGIDKKLAVHYYARWKFTYDLMPLLRKAKEQGEDAKVLTVLAPGNGGKIDLDDLGLKKRYSTSNAAYSAPTYNDLMIESFAARNPKMAFIHAYPGVVRTPLLKATNPLLRPFNPLMTGLLYPISHAPADTGEFMLYNMLQSNEGWFRRGDTGEDMGKKKYYSTDEGREKLWEHTVKETGTVGDE
ncbi:NAD(P)-binding protein [Punctularia strigosozonata HHB-11173 SS5]|uniref:NAD(P)-binding protein n=1 Tax=Punctularia strigosozonata (strain HHB-11173) TaxID=741275 RepID=UPI00044171E8|nr:NAD(P)-binding protein [Punctularia strigosozonata HHB-11173 SS5]EIN08968.1 NAD(P)-binding protein [Punctularia strigosozonata HHB-11173 SS5]